MFFIFEIINYKEPHVSENFFDKLKSSLARGASQSATKIEEAAKTGKIHLDILNEKRKLATQFEELGQYIYAEVEAIGEEDADENPELIKRIGKIKLIKDEISKLRSKLDQGEKVDEEDEDFKSGV